MNDILIFINELKDKSIKKYKMIGIISSLVLSFNIFKKNENLKPFVLEIFQLTEQFKNYAYASRTILVSKLVRKIYDSDEKYYEIVRGNLLLFLINLSKEENMSKPKKGGSSSIGEWIGIKDE